MEPNPFRHTYKIKQRANGKWELSQNGDWLGTYTTEVEAMMDRDQRADFDRIRQQQS